MKRFLLTLVCCSPLLLSSASSFGLSLIGPNGEQVVAYEKYGPISKIETLWAVSSKLRPDRSVTIQQTLVAIYKTNPDAFLNGNVNKLISGSVINIPDLSYVQTQTDQEATELLAKYSQPKNVVTAKPAPKKAVAKKVVVKKDIATNQKAETTKNINVPKIQATETKQQQSTINKQLAALKAELAALNKEFDHVDEQLIVEIEKNQSLKLKMQPLYDQIESLKEQLAEQFATQEKMQGVIDDYQAQLDKVKARPFSGEGFFNELLRTITSSLTYLLIAILSPLLLLIAVFGLLMRLASKRKLAEQEKELAESTSNLMEESGQFDSLLTGDIEEEDGDDLDFMAPPEEKAPEDEVISIDDIGDLENELESIDLSDNSITSLKDEVFHDGEDDAADIEEDVPVSIDALSEEPEESVTEESVTETDAKPSNEFEPLEATEDDPFGIAGLTGDIEENQELEIVEANNDEETESEALSEEERAAAEWESSLAEMEESPEGKQSDVVVENEASTAAPTELEKIEEALLEQEADIEASTPAEAESSDEEVDVDEAPVEQAAEIDVSAPTEAESSDEEVAVDEAPVELAAEIDVSVPTEAESSDEEVIVDDTPVDEATDIEMAMTTEPNNEADVVIPENEEIEELHFQEDDDNHIAEINNVEKDGKVDPDLLLAQQLSDVSFNEDVPLPKIDAANKNDFIDIETLLGEGENSPNEEPYTEFNLDLGLDEFPDVINSDENESYDKDDKTSAQLDLARAYIEIDDKQGAKDILLSIADESDEKQRVEIDKLLSQLS